MAKISVWLEAFRLRTLPLAFSCILIGAGIALKNENFNIFIFIGCLTTTLLLQILSNLANDYGDAIKGTDNENRIGPDRAVQKGLISKKEMKSAIIINSILGLISASWLIYLGLKGATLNTYIVYLILTLLSIIAAITYTIGKKAYGYSGLGDLSVYIFFGLIGVLASSYLYGHLFSYKNILIANTIGMLSASVLNLNNMRDVTNDKLSSKNTLVVKVGIEKAKKYHSFLIVGSLISLLLFLFFTNSNSISYLSVLVYILFFIDLKKINLVKDYQHFDPFLKKTAIKTFTIAFIYFISQLF